MGAAKELDVDFRVDVVKTDKSRRLVFGHLIVCKVNGEDYRDTDGTLIDEETMLDSALEWAQDVAVATSGHAEEVGTHPFLFPMTTEIAKAFGWENPPKTGLMVGTRVDAATFAKCESGELKAFSVAGKATVEWDEE